MPEVTNNTPRLLAAAKEFNIGKGTLIDFLANKGYSTDGFESPNARLTAEMYSALQSEFQQDKANKRKSDQIALPKGSVLDAMKKKEKEAAEAAGKKSGTKEEPATAIETPPQAEKPKQEPAPEPAPVQATAPQQPEAPVTPVAPPPKTEAATPPPASEVTKTESPRLNGPKVVATIDLNALQGKKPAARKEEPPVEEKAPAKQPETVVVTTPVAKTPPPEVKEEKVQETPPAPVKEEKPAPVAEKPEVTAAPPTPQPQAETPKAVEKEKPAAPAAEQPAPPKEKEEKKPQEAPPAAREVKEPAPVAAQQKEPETAPAERNIQDSEQDDNSSAVIENIQAEKLTGPKVIGKINLPIQSDRRDNNKSTFNNRNNNNNNNNDEKRKRKRIIVEKKPEPIQPKEFSGEKREGAGAPTNRTGDNNNNRFGNRDNRPGGGDNRHHQGGGGNRPHGGGGQGGQGGGNRPHQPGQGPSRPHAAPNRGPGGPGGGNRGPGGGNRGPGGNRDNRGGFNRGPGDPNRRPEDKEIDKNEIQNKIKETMAKLGGGRGKNIKAKQRRDKRDARAEEMANQNAENNKLQVTEFISVSELANLMDVSFAEVISKCMSLGIMVSINQRLDAEVIELVSGEFGYEVEFIGIDDVDTDEEEEEVDAEEDLSPRAPIVTIMGHVDHGKTSLLDYIRSANVVAGEAGGITQHIGAYQVTTATGKKLTFLDTPGHEAFTAMRARGAKAADIAVIVVAADDAIMPQTREAISHSQAAGLPMVFAINKIDKEGANPEKIKEQLAGMNLLVEDWGGKYQSQEISAKSGLNIDVLLEKILLEAELLELKANPAREASGSIIEASLDKGRGYVASVLVQNGTLHQGDTIVSGAFYGKIKAMFNERGQRIDEAGPSSPVQLLGLNGAPQAGEKFRMYVDEGEAKDVANRRAQIVREQGIRTKKHITLDEIGRRLALGNFKQLNIIIKGDFDGSVEALSDSLQKLSTEEIAISVVHKAVGQITESDVLLATASDAIIVGFQVRPSSNAAKLAEKENIEIRTYSIIYDAIEELKSAMEGMLEPKIEKKVVANVEIRETYRFDKVTVAGCFVLDGKLARNTRINLVRDGIVIFTGELGSLKRYKDDVKEVVSNMECGLSIRNYNDLKTGDIVEGFEEVEVKRTL